MCELHRFQNARCDDKKCFIFKKKEARSRLRKLKSVWLYYVPSSMIRFCVFLFCWAHAAGISVHKFSVQISNAVSIIRGKKEMFGRTKVLESKTPVIKE